MAVTHGCLRGEAVGADQAQRVPAGDLRQAGHHDDVGGDDAPAAQPSGPRPECAGGPRKGGAAVGICLVQLPERVRDAQHRQERHDQHRWRMHADDAHDEAEGGGHAVGGRRRRHGDDDAGDQAECAGPQSLARWHPGSGDGFCCHGSHRLSSGAGRPVCSDHTAIPYGRTGLRYESPTSMVTEDSTVPTRRALGGQSTSRRLRRQPRGSRAWSVERGQSTVRMTFRSAAVPAPPPPSAVISSRICQSFAASSRDSAARSAGSPVP